MDLFHKLNTMDWGRVSLIVAAITAFWIGLAAIVPERYHHVGAVILAALSNAITLMMRSGKSLVEKAEDNLNTAHAQVVEHIVEQVAKETQP